MVVRVVAGAVGPWLVALPNPAVAPGSTLAAELCQWCTAGLIALGPVQPPTAAGAPQVELLAAADQQYHKLLASAAAAAVAHAEAAAPAAAAEPQQP